MNADKVGQKSTTGTFLQHNLSGLGRAVCMCVCVLGGGGEWVVVDKSPSTATAKNRWWQFGCQNQ